MKNNLLPIAKEGWNYIAYTLAFFILTLFLDLNILSFISFILILFLGYSFRNPERELPIFEDKSVLSPVDGVVTSIEELIDSEYLYKLTIESRYSDVSVLRAPISANVELLGRFNGARLCLTSALGKKINENTTFLFIDKYANKVKVKHIVKQSFCGIKTDSTNKCDLVQSARYGVMVNGISEIYLPENFRLNISLADEVKASQTLLGYFS